MYVHAHTHVHTRTADEPLLEGHDGGGEVPGDLRGALLHGAAALAQLPLLELDDGTRLREGPAIVQYVADQAPNRNLAPAAGTLPRYRLQEWLTFIGTEIHKSFSPLFNPAMPEEGKQIYRDRLANRFAFVDKELAGKDYLMGDHFTVADAYLYTVTRWAKPMALDLTPFPNLQKHQERVGARPAVQEALKFEKLS